METIFNEPVIADDTFANKAQWEELTDITYSHRVLWYHIKIQVALLIVLSTVGEMLSYSLPWTAIQ